MIPEDARFTDNRQDAALQSGHFNDFLFLFWSEVHFMCLETSNKRLTEEDLAEKVFVPWDSIG